MALPEHANPPPLPRHQHNRSPPPPEDAAAGRRSRSITTTTWITAALGVLLFMFTCVLAVYRSQRYGVIVSSCLVLFFLVACLKRSGDAEPGCSELRDLGEVSVWIFTVALAFMFSSQVATVAPPAVAAGVCLMAVGAVAAGLCYYKSVLLH